MDEANQAQVTARSGWLAAYRVANAVLFVLPLVTWIVSLPEESRFTWITHFDDLRPQSLVELVAWLILAAPFALILWGARRNPPSKFALAISAGVSLPIVFVTGWMVMASIVDGPDWQTLGLSGLVLLVSLGYVITTAMIYNPIRSTGDKTFLRVAVLTPILIVVLFAFVVPLFLRSCCGSNESSSVGSLRTINTAEVTYASTYPELGFACKLSTLGPSGSDFTSTAAGLIDSVLASGSKSGYTFAIASCGRDNYQVFAEPLPTNKNDKRAFCTDQTGVIRFSGDRSGVHCLTSGKQLQ